MTEEEEVLRRLEAIEREISQLALIISRLAGFVEELAPFLEMARTYVGGSKGEKLRMMIRNGR